MEHSRAYIIGFAAAVCVVCSIFVAGSAVGLHERQIANATLDRQTKVLDVAGLIDNGAQIGADEIGRIFDESIRPMIIDFTSGEYDDAVDPETYDATRLVLDPATSWVPPANPAKVLRRPVHGLVYHVVGDDGTVSQFIFPIEGKGLWSTLKGFLALDRDLQTIRGITYYDHKETPGLGGEVDNPKWKALWPGRKAFGEDGAPQISVVKGQAGTPADDPHRVDGLSGATITSRGVTHMLDFWLGEHGYGPYINRIQGEGGAI